MFDSLDLWRRIERILLLDMWIEAKDGRRYCLICGGQWPVHSTACILEDTQRDTAEVIRDLEQALERRVAAHQRHEDEDLEDEDLLE